MNKMFKEVFSVMMSVCLAVVSAAGYPAHTVYAADNRFNTDDFLAVLNDVTTSGQAWESIGFSSEDIAEIAQMPRKTGSYYQSINEQINLLAVETEQTLGLESALAEQETVSPYAQDGNPPETPQEQNERLKYVAQEALNRYGNTYNTENFNKYVLYLYMSHYIDNPNYSKNNPGFDNIYAYIITSDDIRAYENFIAQSKFSMFSTNLVNFVSEIKSAGDNISDLKQSVSKGKTISVNTANAVYGLSSFNPSDTVRRAELIVTSFKNHYETEESIAELLDAIYVDLEPENIEKQYIDTCVTGFLGVLAGTATVFGFGLSISLCYYNVYMNLYDKARLTALHYSLSGRVAVRLDALIWG